MNKKRLLVYLSIILLVSVIGICIYIISKTVYAAEDESLRWTMIGALGSWAGSFFAAVALIISLLAFRLPQKVKLKVDFNEGMMISQMPGGDKINAYIITVKNIGMRSVTVNNVYLNFGGRNKDDIYVGMLNQNSLLQAYTPTFPKRLDQGASFDYYLLKNKLDTALAHYERKTTRSTPLYIRVNEVTKGDQYYKTKRTLESFIGHINEQTDTAM